MKHTPGPWYLDECSDGSLLIQPREGFSICPVTPREGFESDMPNFRLMAAAPELLAVCKWLVDYAPTPADAARARAAIRKAEGRG